MPAPRRTAKPSHYRFFATAAKGLEPIVADELRALGAAEVKEERGGASFAGPPALAYRACLWLRSANRVLFPVTRFPVADGDGLYAAVNTLPWEQDISPDGSLAVQFSGVVPGITHTHYGAQRIKDAVVDRLRERFGRRPDVDREQPDVLINCHVHRGIATLSIDLSGDSLHQRGYRVESVAAPLKENLAAALLLKCGWPAIAAAGGSFTDPMCGSGTLVIEAALMAGDIAPGLWRTRWGFSRWLRHDAATWDKVLQDARRRRHAGLRKLPVLLGFDQDRRAIEIARRNAARVGLGDALRLRPTALADTRLPPRLTPGLVLTNPPYGERLGEVATLAPLYAELGHWLKNQCLGWHAGFITGHAELGKHTGLRAVKRNTFYNGALECKLLQFNVGPDAFMREKPAAP